MTASKNRKAEWGKFDERVRELGLNGREIIGAYDAGMFEHPRRYVTGRPCLADGCDAPSVARRYCMRHYQASRRGKASLADAIRDCSCPPCKLGWELFGAQWETVKQDMFKPENSDLRASRFFDTEARLARDMWLSHVYKRPVKALASGWHSWCAEGHLLGETQRIVEMPDGQETAVCSVCNPKVETWDGVARQVAKGMRFPYRRREMTR